MLRTCILSLLCLLFVASAWCGDAPEPDIIPAATATQLAAPPWWQQLIAGVVTAVVTFYLVPMLRAKAAEATAAAEHHKIDSNASLIDQKGAIIIQLEAYLYKAAASIAEKRFPRLAAGIVAGRYSSALAVREELRLWGDDLKEQAIDAFKIQGIDLIGTVGHDLVESMIEHAANAVSPFPGKETAVALLKDGVAPMLIDKGIEWMRRETAASPSPQVVELGIVTDDGKAGTVKVLAPG